ncbi:MAG: FAD-dependent oxidoreductase [Candidatus Pacebacteria bacterium]|nr:FAD-dependent oxidoreductase [Candidatus Paceibacterota bacterium]
MIYDVIIIGGGPAGVAAGIYASRQRLNALLITKSFGGQMARKAVAIENYPGFEEISGLDLIKKFEKHLRKFTSGQPGRGQIKIELALVSKIKKAGKTFSVLTGKKKKFKSKTVLIASGADPRPLEVPGEKKFIGKGVSYCTACDAPLYAGKDVVVVGGGNSGFEAALFLAGWVRKLYILENSSKVSADQSIQEKAKKTGKIKVITSAALKKVEGKKFVESLVYQDNETKKTVSLKVGGIFVEIGSQPATSFVKGLVDFSERDEIVIDQKTMQTKTTGLFAAGDVSDVIFKQIVVAAGEGTKALLAISNYLQKNGWN